MVLNLILAEIGEHLSTLSLDKVSALERWRFFFSNRFFLILLIIIEVFFSFKFFIDWIS
jgi:hypothetical protein